MHVHLPAFRSLPSLALLAGLAGCAPFITPGRRAQDLPPTGLLRSDLAGAQAACEGAQGATAYFLGAWTINPDHGTVLGADQIAIFANSAWQAAGGADCWFTFAVGGSTSGDLGSEVQLDVTDDWVPDDHACSRSDFFVSASSETAWTGQISGDTLTLKTDQGGTFVQGALDGKDFTYATDGFCVRRHEGGASSTTTSDTSGVIGPTQNQP